MNREKLEAIIEGVLFAIGDAVSMDKLSEVVGVEKDKLIEIVTQMAKKYDEDPNRGVRIIRLEDSFQLCTKTELYEYVRMFIERKGRNSLSNAALEVLSIVAYNQPVTRSTIEFIRGVNSDGSLAKLVELGLVDEVGRLDAPGRPVLFGTTEEFLRCFSISSLENLPEIDIMSAEEELGEYETEQNGTNENLDT
jgi:segregation and condensation protein B